MYTYRYTTGVVTDHRKSYIQPTSGWYYTKNIRLLNLPLHYRRGNRSPEDTSTTNFRLASYWLTSSYDFPTRCISRLKCLLNDYLLTANFTYELGLKFWAYAMSYCSLVTPIASLNYSCQIIINFGHC